MSTQPCAKCGQPHPRCRAHNRAGQPCRKPPVAGAPVCVTHGGKAPQVQAAAQTRLTLAAQERAMTLALAEAFGDNPPPIDPAEAMLFAVAAKHAEVVWLRRKVAEVDEADLVWGVTREKVGGDDHGTTTEAKPNVWWTMLRTAEDQLVKFAAAARAAGCEEARVRLAEGQGQLVADAIRRILDALNLTDEQAALVPQIVPGALRAIGGVA